MIGLGLVRNALDVENELVLLEPVGAQIVNQRKVCIRAARAVRRCAHIPGKIFPAVNLNTAFLPPFAVWSGVDRFHQRPRRYIARIANDWRPADLPVSAWKWRRIEGRRWNRPWRGRSTRVRRCVGRCL